MNFDRADALRRLADRGLRRPRRRRGHHRDGRRARRGDAWPARRARRQGRLRVRHFVEVVEARARRHPLPAAEGSRARLRSARRTADAAQHRAAPRARAPLPPPRLHPRRPAAREARAHPRRDDVGVRPHRRARASASCTSASRRTKRSRTCRRFRSTGSPRRTSTTTRRPTTRGSRSPSRRPPPTTAPRSRTTRSSSASRRTPPAMCTAARVRAGDEEFVIRARTS